MCARPCGWEAASCCSPAVPAASWASSLSISIGHACSIHPKSRSSPPKSSADSQRRWRRMRGSERRTLPPMAIEPMFEDQPEAALPPSRRAGGLSRALRAAWPKLAAVAIALLLWQLVFWSGWRPDYVLPSPIQVFGRLFQDGRTAGLWLAIGITMQRAIIGYAIAVVVGTLLGLLMVRVRLLRAAMGSLITGLQSMPSVAWFPLAILIYKLSEAAILFVVILGAAPSSANGVLAGVDHIPPIILRAARVMGARGVTLYARVI